MPNGFAEFLFSWPAGIIGALALGVLGNLLTPPIRAAIASTNRRRKAKLVAALSQEYQLLHEHLQRGTLIYVVLSRWFRNVGISILMAALMGIMITYQIYVQMINMSGDLPSDVFLNLLSPDKKKLFYEIYRFVLMALLAVFSFLFSRSLTHAQRASRFGSDPEKERGRILTEIRRIDPSFAAERLPRK